MSSAVGGAGVDAPAVAEPVHVDRAQDAVLVANVEDVHATVDEEFTRLTFGLCLHLGKHVHECHIGLVAELVQNRLVNRSLGEPRYRQRRLTARSVDVAGAREEPRIEVVAEVGADSSVLLQLELSVGDERFARVRRSRGADELEQGRNYRHCLLPLSHELREVGVEGITVRRSEAVGDIEHEPQHLCWNSDERPGQRAEHVL